jgi:hypothetical protein
VSDAKPWEAYAPTKKPLNPGPWDEYAKAQGKPPKSLVESARGVGGEVLSQLGRVAGGAVETGKTALQLTPPGMAIRGPKATQETLKRTGKGIAEGVMAPVRELGAIPQPGERDYKPLPFGERPFAAVGTALGADPARVRKLESEGKSGEAWAARLTAPALAMGLQKALGMPSGRLPPTGARVGKLASALDAVSTPSGRSAAATIERTLPVIDRVVARTGQTPRNLEGWLGAGFQASEDLKTEYGLALQPMRAQIADTSGLVGELRQSITDEMRRAGQEVSQARAAKVPMSQVPKSTREAADMGEALEREAQKFEVPRSYGELDSMRTRLANLQRETMAGRAAARSDVDLRIAQITERNLKTSIYDGMGQFHGDPGRFAKLQGDRSALIDLTDLLTKRAVEVSDKAAIDLGKTYLEKIGFSTYGTPMSGKMGIALHRLHAPLTGGPQKVIGRKVTRAFSDAPIASRPKRAAAAALFGRVPKRDEE